MVVTKDTALFPGHLLLNALVSCSLPLCENFGAVMIDFNFNGTICIMVYPHAFWFFHYFAELNMTYIEAHRYSSHGVVKVLLGCRHSSHGVKSCL